MATFSRLDKSEVNEKKRKGKSKILIYGGYEFKYHGQFKSKKLDEKYRVYVCSETKRKMSKCQMRIRENISTENYFIKTKRKSTTVGTKVRVWENVVHTCNQNRANSCVTTTLQISNPRDYENKQKRRRISGCQPLPFSKTLSHFPSQRPPDQRPIILGVFQNFCYTDSTEYVDVFVDVPRVIGLDRYNVDPKKCHVFFARDGFQKWMDGSVMGIVPREEYGHKLKNYEDEYGEQFSVVNQQDNVVGILVNCPPCTEPCRCTVNVFFLGYQIWWRVFSYKTRPLSGKKDLQGVDTKAKEEEEEEEEVDFNEMNKGPTIDINEFLKIYDRRDPDDFEDFVNLDDAGGTRLNYAVGKGRIDIVKKLVEEMKVPIMKSDIFGNTSIDVADHFGYEKITEYLVSKLRNPPPSFTSKCRKCREKVFVDLDSETIYHKCSCSSIRTKKTVSRWKDLKFKHLGRNVDGERDLHPIDFERVRKIIREGKGVCNGCDGKVKGGSIELSKKFVFINSSVCN